MSEWLELELAHQLAPTTAPDGLWEQIQSGAPLQPAASRQPAARYALPRWPIAAILTLMVAAATLWLAAKGQEPALDLEQLALEQLHEPAALDLATSDPSEIANWMRQQAGVSLPHSTKGLPGSGPVRLAGVRLIRKRGARIAAVEYTVGGDAARLLVARIGDGTETAHGQFSWKSGGQLYGLACSNPDHSGAACLLCHASL